MKTDATQGMNEQEVLEYVQNRIKEEGGELLLLSKTGSKLYGLETPESDDDYLGVYLPKKELLFGFNEQTELDLSYEDKNESGKNTSDAIDIKIYTLKHFLLKAAENNPNIIELLFVESNPKTLLFISDDFKIFTEKYELFINERVKRSFKGYAESQMRKGRVKADNYIDLMKFETLLKDFLKDNPKADDKMTLGEVQHFDEFKSVQKFFTRDGIRVSNLTFPRNIFIKKALKMIREKLHAASHRAKDWEKYGYDRKFFSHLFRLLIEGEDLIKEKKLVFPIKQRKQVLDIKLGKYSLEEIEKLADKRMKEFEELEVDLPEKANYKEIEKLYIDLLQRKLCQKGD